MKIAVLYGGQSGEHEISILSARSVVRALVDLKHDVQAIGITKQGKWHQQSIDFLLNGTDDPRKIQLETAGSPLLPFKDLKVDIVFPVLHGPYGEDGSMQGLLELTGIPYVGSGVLASSLCMDKDICKRLCLQAGIPVARYEVIQRALWKTQSMEFMKHASEQLSFPVFVKPANQGSSVGISKVEHPSGLEAAIEQALHFDNKVLVEQGIIGRELECGVIGHDEAQASVVGEIIPGEAFYSYAAKYHNEIPTRLDVPADIPEAIVRQIQNYAKQAFAALQCSGLARVDFLWDETANHIYLNEVNTMPGLTANSSMFPRMWDVTGVSFKDLIQQLINYAQNN